VADSWGIRGEFGADSWRIMRFSEAGSMFMRCGYLRPGRDFGRTFARTFGLPDSQLTASFS
jgi:hypothetical protein